MKLLKRLLPFFLLCSSCFGALDATIVWEVRVLGAQTNGGGYKPGASGTDYSQQAAAQYALTTVTSAGATATMTHASAAAVMVGNTCRVVSGTNATLGWYEIISVVAGVSLTVDRNWCTGAVANGVVNVGGAFLIGGTLDADFFSSTNKESGNTIWVAAGTYTLGESITTTDTYLILEGYSVARGDKPTGTNRPLISGPARYINFASGVITKFISFTSTSSTGTALFGTYAQAIGCKFVNTGTTVTAFAADSDSPTTFINCEFINNYGYGLSLNTVAVTLINCYIHDCATGIYEVGSGTGRVIINCIIDTCQTGIVASALSFRLLNSVVRNCVTGISGAGNYDYSIINNIFADNVTGVSWDVEPTSYLLDYNCWSNNTTDVTNVTKGSHDVTADALLVSGTAKGTDGATSASGLVFTAASNPFGLVTTSDCLNIVEAGTGATLGVYVISSVDGAGQITLATSAGASKTGIDYCITLGTDFTLSAGSPCFDAGLQLGSDVGL